MPRAESPIAQTNLSSPAFKQKESHRLGQRDLAPLGDVVTTVETVDDNNDHVMSRILTVTKTTVTSHFNLVRQNPIDKD